MGQMLLQRWLKSPLKSMDMSFAARMFYNRIILFEISSVINFFHFGLLQTRCNSPSTRLTRSYLCLPVPLQ